MTDCCLTLRIDTGITLPGSAAPLHLAVEIRAPRQASLGAAPVVLYCLPGGAMNRRFYDLMPPAQDGEAASDISFSFARQMAGRGFIVVFADHLGVGDSDRPEDGYLLTPDVIVRANQVALEQVLAGLRAGTLLHDLPPLPDLVSVGVGHSMGAMMTVLQQAAHRPHRALALLGFSTRGMPEYVAPEIKKLAEDPAAVRAELPRLAKALFVLPYPEMKPSPQANAIFAGAAADPRGVEAVKAARDRMLPVPAFMSMLPGNVAAEAAQIDVPLLLALGERDIAGPTHQVPAAFTRSRDICLHILPETGHSHFLFPARTGLFNRLGGWARQVL